MRWREQQHDAHHGDEEDELLAHRVEAAIVEHHRGDDVRHVALLRDDPVEHVAVRAAVVAEARDRDERPRQQHTEQRQGRQEDADPDAAAHLRLRLRAIAISTMSG